MRVLHVLEPEPDGEVGGADLHVLDLVSAQKARGEIDPYVLINQSFDFATRLIDRRIVFFPGHQEGRGLFRFAMRLGDLPCLKDADIIHGHGYESNYLIAILRVAFPSSWGRLPVVMTCHGWVETLLKHRLKTALDFWTYRFASALIICSRNQLSRLKNRFPHKPVAYIPNGVILQNTTEPTVDLEKLSTIRASGQKIVGFVGRLAPEKRVDLVVNIFSRVSELIPGVHLVVIGSGSKKNDLIRQVVELGLESQVHFLGYVRNVGPLYPFFDVLVQTSETESTSRVVAESMLSGIPVVASRVGGLVDMIDDEKSGFLCSFGDVEGFRRIVAQLLRDEALRSAIGLAGKRRASRDFTIEAMEHAVADVYRHVLAS